MPAVGCRDRTAALGRYRGSRTARLRSYERRRPFDLFDDRVGAAAPTTDGGVLVALADRLAMVDLGDESVRTLVEIPHGDGLRLNDGACDPAGRLRELGARLRPGRGARSHRYSSDDGLEWCSRM